jgi:hypothetical protein
VRPWGRFVSNSRLRYRECDGRGKAVVSIRWGKTQPGHDAETRKAELVNADIQPGPFSGPRYAGFKHLPRKSSPIPVAEKSQPGEAKGSSI